MSRLNKEKRKLEIELQKKNQRKKKVSSEEMALSELKVQLSKKGITPEGFFRLCDSDYTKSVPTDKFKEVLSKMRLGLSRGQQSRLALILDEDQEGNISLEEF